MYPDSGYKRAHVQSVCTRPFSRVGRGLGTRLNVPLDLVAAGVARLAVVVAPDEGKGELINWFILIDVMIARNECMGIHVKKSN